MATLVPSPHSATGGDPGAVTALEVRGLTRRFGTRLVLDSVSLTVVGGERAGLWGPNGSGKTTLLRCVAGTLTPSEGDALVYGRPAGSRAARHLLGVSLGQERAFYPRLSGRENLLLAARLRLRPSLAAGAVAAICDELELGQFVDVPVERWSSGMRARLAVGRALLGNPRMLLLDEPTRSLDDPASRLVWAAIERRSDLTVVVASPRLEDLSSCSRVIDLTGMAPAHNSDRAPPASPPFGRSFPPALQPASRSAIPALVRRDLALRRVVKFALALDLLFGALNLIVYKFIGRLMHGQASGSVARAGGYFSFAAVGIAFFLVIQTATTGITRQVRDEVRSGTLELVVAQPVGPGSLALGLAGFPFLFATSRALIYLLVAAALGLEVAHANWAGVVVMLAAAAPALAAIGIVLAALSLILERGDVVGRFVGFGLAFLSGAYFPVSELAPPVRAVSAALPTHVALDGLRAALGGASWWSSAAALVGFDLVTLPLAVALFTLALGWARRHGRLTRG